jgi:hypothetical protein
MRSSILSTGIAAVAVVLLAAGHPRTSSLEDDGPDVRSYPKDTEAYTRNIDAGDRSVSRVHPKVFLRDTVVSNTNPNLTNTDIFNDGELSIAINPDGHDEIVITSFTTPWGANAAWWHSTDRGVTWTKQLTIPAPPGIAAAAGCPCDQTIDWGRGGQLSGTFLSFGPTNVYSGTTFNPAAAASFNWFVTAGVTQRTNLVALNNADQPWLLVNRDPANDTQDNVYVGYDDFSNPGAPPMRVSVSYGVVPPFFTVDRQTGTSTGSVNPGHRLAKDPRTGTMYSLWQRRIAAGAGGSQNINYMLNRSTDGGQTWPLGGGNGIIVGNGDSTQPWPKFGGVNALLGGVLHAAVSPSHGDLYYVYGKRDAATNNNRLVIRQITTDSDGTLNIGAESFVTGQVQAALPSVAVTPNGEVGVFFYTFDGTSGTGFPIFTTHIAISSDEGATFRDTPLLTFQSSALPSGNLFDRQRVFGDYMQLKVAGGTFYGAFTGNGVAFGRPFANHDPIFFRVQATGPK